MTWIEDTLGRWVVKRRWWIIGLMTPLIAVAAAGIQHIRISNDTRVFFGDDNPDYQTLKAFEQTYSKEQSVFFVLAPKDENVFTRKGLAAVCDLTDAGWRLPYSTRVTSLTNFQRTRAEGDELIVESLVADPNALSERQLESIRRTALSETAIVDRLISSRGHVAGVYVSLITPPESTRASAGGTRRAGPSSTCFGHPLPRSSKPRRRSSS